MIVNLLAVYSDPPVFNCQLEILTGLETEMGKGQSLKALHLQPFPNRGMIQRGNHNLKLYDI